MGIEDHKLRVFCTVAETKSFSKTSEIIHLTQPAVSLQIQALEEQYETKLFDRSGTSISLTTAGEILYKYSKNILSQYAEVEREIGKITGLIKGSIKVGAGTTIGNYILPSVIIDFKRVHPKIKINVFIGNARRIVDLLNSGFIDFGIVGVLTAKTKIKAEPLIADELGVIVPSAHPWVKKKVVSVAELTREPFIFREDGSGTRQVIEKYLSRHGISAMDLHIVSTLGSTGSIKEAVESGMGVSILSKWAVRKEVKNGILKFIVPKEGKILREFILVRCKQAILSPAVDEFIAFLQTYPFEKML